MFISKYNNYILENKFYDLICEAQIQYFKDLENILKELKSPIASDLLELSGKDIDVTSNYFNITDKDDMLSFYRADTKFKYKIIDSDTIYTSFKSLCKLVGIPYKDYDLPDGTIGEVKKIYTKDDLREIYDAEIAHFVSDNGENCFIDINGLEKIKSESKPQEAKIGRLALKLLKSNGKKYNDKELESFVNEFKAKIAIIKDKLKLFELVKGEDIKYWYSDNRYDYEKEGSLHGSCMRYDDCQQYFGIYIENSKVCSLLILKSENDEDLIQARALVWTLSDGTIFMDRVYFSYESQVELFKAYAISKGWCFKQKQNSSDSENIIFDNEGSHYTKDLKVELEKSEFGYYPYMDTLKYISKKKKTLSNDSKGSDGSLESTDGDGPECDDCDGSGSITCEQCDGDGSIECEYCDGEGEIVCGDCDGDEVIDCGACDGEGEIEDENGNMKSCDDCNGEGHVKCKLCKGLGSKSCTECDGDGSNECNSCDGEGSIECTNCDNGR